MPVVTYKFKLEIRIVGRVVDQLNFSTVSEKVHMERVAKILPCEICIHCIAQSN